MTRAAATALAAALVASAAGAGPAVPRFVEQTEAAGIDSVYRGGWEHIVGGGVAAFDCDGDAFPDLFLAGGEDPARLYRNAGTSGGPLRFERVESGLEATGVTGAWPLDVDADGLTDLVVTRAGEALAMRGLGGCRFERANEAWGFDGGDAWWTAFAAVWERGAAWPTLALGAYVDRREEGFPWGSCTPNVLIRPATDGPGFAPPAPLDPSHCALSMLFTDWRRSGTADLRISNDREYYKGGQEQLWRIAPGAPPSLWREEEGWRRLRIWGMGVASHDLDADGFPEFFLTSMADNKLQALEAPGSGAPAYADIAFDRGVTAHRPHVGGDVRPSTAWHAEFGDANNDGRADLFIAKGNVDAMPDFAERDPDNLLLQGSDGKFVEAAAAAGVASPLSGRGAALVDLDLDGWLDLVVVNRNEPAQLWRNAGAAGGGGALLLRLTQPGPNRDAVGARIEARAPGLDARREIAVGGGHAGGQLGWVHVGIGAAPEASVRVIWPDGEEGAWRRLAPGRHVIDRAAAP